MYTPNTHACSFSSPKNIEKNVKTLSTKNIQLEGKKKISYFFAQKLVKKKIAENIFS
jgi:hypothetical protein